MNTTVARMRRTSRFGTAAMRKSWISSVITSSASENQIRWSALSSSTSVAFGIRSARYRACSIEMTRSRLACRTSVGATTIGRAWRTSIWASTRR